MQQIIAELGSINRLSEVLEHFDCQMTMIVCDKSYSFLGISSIVDNLGKGHVFFDKFSSNPVYEDVCAGVVVFNEHKCDSIIAIGGGSAIDVAKCIKLFCCMDDKINYLEQKFVAHDIPLIAIPTTAGTGSESTRFAVIYYNDIKQSIAHDSILPNVAVLDGNLLKTLPVYQRKCTMMDALCQGIESYWSVNSTDESKEYARTAINKIITNYNEYIFNARDSIDYEIMVAANYSGRAINITQTTAPHAMSYKLSSLYKIPHGHAVAICLPKVWRFMAENINQCVDSRGERYVEKTFQEIANIMSCNGVNGAIEKFERVLQDIELTAPLIDKCNLDLLTRSVNLTRLNNNPITLRENDIKTIYSCL